MACVSCVQVSFTLKVFVKGKWWVPSASHPVPWPLLSRCYPSGHFCESSVQRLFSYFFISSWATPSTSHPWKRILLSHVSLPLAPLT